MSGEGWIPVRAVSSVAVRGGGRRQWATVVHGSGAGVGVIAVGEEHAGVGVERPALRGGLGASRAAAPGRAVAATVLRCEAKPLSADYWVWTVAVCSSRSSPSKSRTRVSRNSVPTGWFTSAALTPIDSSGGRTPGPDR